MNSITTVAVNQMEESVSQELVERAEAVMKTQSEQITELYEADQEMVYCTEKIVQGIQDVEETGGNAMRRDIHVATTHISASIHDKALEIARGILKKKRLSERLGKTVILTMLEDDDGGGFVPRQSAFDSCSLTRFFVLHC